MGNPVIKTIKEEFKSLANEIKTFKSLRKKYKGFVPGLNSMRSIYRHKHIAYCELRGMERKDIEIPGEFNKADEGLIEKYKTEWNLKLEKYNAEHPKPIRKEKGITKSEAIENVFGC
ncbi:hypothetical protein M0R19_08270 [Candidatus Pacearchaeota archaeon]|jgi:hypothetical protein|nr:hypothetical protein [bacterium]MCK9597152.1 hypothetical protein [Candidatus Pacearchaeota archaeon]